MKLHLPHPLILLLACVLVAAAVTHVLPAGQYDRKEDSATGRTIVVPGTYHRVAAAPVGPFAAVVAVPRGMVAAGEVIMLILLVGGAWAVVDKVGTLAMVVDWLVAHFGRRPHVIIALLSIAFAAGGALENMQEEIIPLIPVLLLMGRALGYDAVTVAALSVGSAMVGSAFSPINPFQAGIALKLAQLPPLSGAGLRMAMLAVALAFWIGWTVRHAAKTRTAPQGGTIAGNAPFEWRHGVVVALVVAPFAAYVIGALKYGWGFNELSAGFLIAGIAIGLVGRLGLQGTVDSYLDGVRSVVAAAMLVGVARSISLVLDDGHVIDTILQALATPLAAQPRSLAAVLMVPVQAVLHVPVSSVSGQAVLTMPVMIPMSDLLGVSRQAAVLAYQTGAGLTEMWTPTNGSMMAVLLAAGAPFGKWIRFVVPAVLVLTVLGIVGVLLAG